MDKSPHAVRGPRLKASLGLSPRGDPPLPHVRRIAGNTTERAELMQLAERVGRELRAAQLAHPLPSAPLADGSLPGWTISAFADRQRAGIQRHKAELRVWDRALHEVARRSFSEIAERGQLIDAARLQLAELSERLEAVAVDGLRRLEALEEHVHGIEALRQDEQREAAKTFAKGRNALLLGRAALVARRGAPENSAAPTRSLHAVAESQGATPTARTGGSSAAHSSTVGEATLDTADLVEQLLTACVSLDMTLAQRVKLIEASLASLEPETRNTVLREVERELLAADLGGLAAVSDGTQVDKASRLAREFASSLNKLEEPMQCRVLDLLYCAFDRGTATLARDRGPLKKTADASMQCDFGLVIPADDQGPQDVRPSNETRQISSRSRVNSVSQHSWRARREAVGG